MKTHPLARFVVRKRTFFSLVIPIVLIIFAKPSLNGLFAGLILVLIGQAIRIWAAGYISKNKQLAVAGPYAYVRNPLYVGSLFLAAGYCVMSGLWWSWIITAVFYYVFYIGTIVSEEEHLENILGEAYVKYKAAVPRLLPRLSPHHGPNGGSFLWSQVWHNREQRSLTALVIVTALFWLKWALQ